MKSCHEFPALAAATPPALFCQAKNQEGTAHGDIPGQYAFVGAGQMGNASPIVMASGRLMTAG